MLIDEYPQITHRYNLIPDEILKGKCLDIGAGTGERQWFSRHKNFFKSDSYFGIDHLADLKTDLNIVKEDVFIVNYPEASFDVILAIEVVEHFSITLWPEFFKRVCGWLKPNGFLFLTTPRNETAISYKNYSPHEVFGIKESTIREFLPDAKMRVTNHPYLFYDPDSSLLWRIGRGIKRIFDVSSFF